MTVAVGPSPVPVDVLAAPDQTIEAYARWLRRTGLSDSTKRTYEGLARSFVTWVLDQDKHRLDEVFTDPHTRDYAVRDYRRHLLGEVKRAPKGVDTALTAIASVYEWVGLGRPDVRHTTSRQRRAPRALSVEQQRDVFRSAERRGPRDLAILATLIGTGLRVSELGALDVDDVWISARKGQVEVRLGKGEQPRTVPLNAQTRESLAGWLAARPGWVKVSPAPGLFLSREGARLAVRSIRHLIDQVGDAAGVPLAPHVLRHTFATNLIRGGADLVTVADLMGHASVDTTRIYTRPTVADYEAAVERLNVDY